MENLNWYVARFSRDQLDWFTPVTVAMYEKRYNPNPQSQISRMLFTRALVHSRNPRDVTRGIQIAQGYANNAGQNVVVRKQMLYFEAVGHYRKKDLVNSRAVLANYLQVDAHYWRALELRQILQNHEYQVSLVGVCALAGAASLMGGLAVMTAISGFPNPAGEMAQAIPEMEAAYKLRKQLEDRLKNDGYKGYVLLWE